MASGIRRSRRRVLDQGGARARQLEMQRSFRIEEEARKVSRERILRAAGHIPVLKTLDEIVEYATPVRDFLSQRALNFPSLQISKKLDLFEVFAALPQSYKQFPNVVAERTQQPSVGAHFDNYAPDFLPWTIHENLRGRGTIRATFLPVKQYEGYQSLARSLPETDETEELLAQTRASIGRIVLSSVSERQVYVGEIAKGTRTLIWHGDRQSTPAVHDIVREELGDYRIYAHQKSGDIGAGFTPIS